MDGMNHQELEGLKVVSPPQHTSGESKLATEQRSILQVSADEDEPRQGNLLDYFGFNLEEIRQEAREALQDNEQDESETLKLSTGALESGQWACVVCTL